MKNCLLIFLSVIVLRCTALNAQSALDVTAANHMIDSMARTALINGGGYELLNQLCKLGHRLSGSEESIKAIYWIAEQMRMLGFDTVWLQPVQVPVWRRGNIEKAVIHYGRSPIQRELSIGALGGSIGTQGLKAKVLEVSSFDDLYKKRSQAKGAIVFYNIPFDQGTLVTFPSYGKNVGYRARGAIEAARYGAVATIFRSITSKNDNVPHVGVMYYNDSIPKIPAVAIGTHDALFLHDALSSGTEVSVSLELNCATYPDTLSYNVVGDIRGAKTPEKIILVGGHFDCWDKGTGAHDDGAGCIHAIEAALLYKEIAGRPNSTIRAVLFMNEENGSRGANGYAKWSEETHQQHIAVIESDRGGFLPQGFSIEDSAKVVEWQKYLPALEPANILWIKKGGSGVDVSRISCPLKIGFVPDSQRYFDVHHSANDVFESVNMRELELGSAAVAGMIYLIDRK